PTQRYTMRQLYEQLHATKRAEHQAIRAAALALEKAGKLQQCNKTSYHLLDRERYVLGQVDYVSPGYAYIVGPESTQDIWVKHENLLGALNGDTVRVLLLYSRCKKRPSGKVVEIVERSQAPIVGRLERHDKATFVVPDGRRMHYDIFLDTENSKKARDGDKVIVQVTGWPNGKKNPTGVIKEVLGPAGKHEVEMHAIMAEFDLPTRFSKQALAAARAIPDILTDQEIARRRDFRAVTTCTIDPDDAKDFDDALSFSVLPNGHYEVGIHIADVSHYVPEGSLLDQMAYERGTSVYLVDRTISMLPERLSNELCSLRPHEDKLTFSVVFELDADGKIHQQWLGEAIIHSDKRFTYEEAQQVIDQQQGPLCQALTVLNSLAQKLRQQRFSQGAINFETAEVKFQLDDGGKPLKVISKVRKDTHKLVEELMLLANHQVATQISHMVPGRVLPFIYRVHDSPDPDKLSDFFFLAKQLGYPPATKQKSIPQTLNTISTAVMGQAEENILQSLAIRTMAKALYTTDAKPHFGLAFERYTHFTSPIRRYPDVMVHRLLKQFLRKQFQADSKAYEAKCKHASERERVATSAERASIRYKQVEWMQTLQGQVLTGVISSIMEWGIYIELEGSRCEGMVRLADLQDDFYEVDDRGLQVVGRRSRKTYRLGDQVQVSVKACDLTQRTVDLELVQ
ncbi:MAG: ribonuclease R, partial [Bacteroidota bacterium]